MKKKILICAGLAIISTICFSNNTTYAWNNCAGVPSNNQYDCDFDHGNQSAAVQDGGQSLPARVVSEDEDFQDFPCRDMFHRKGNHAACGDADGDGPDHAHLQQRQRQHDHRREKSPWRKAEFIFECGQQLAVHMADWMHE